MIVETTVNGTEYFAVPIDGMWTIREAETGTTICYTSEEKNIDRAIMNALEQEGIRVYGELLSVSDIKRLIENNIQLRKENTFLKEGIKKLGEGL